MTPLLLFVAVLAALLAAVVIRANLRQSREDFIEAYAFPPGVWQRVTGNSEPPPRWRQVLASLHIW